MTSRKLPWVCVILFIAVLLGGCWDRRELDELAIVSGVGVDLAEEPGKYLITAQVIKPSEVKGPSSGGGGQSGASGGGKAYFTVSAEGYTPFEAVRFSATKISRKLYFAHSQALVIGKEVAEQGVRQVLDFFIRDPETRLDQWIYIASSDAKDILESKADLDKIQAMELSNMTQVCQATAQACTMKLIDFYTRLSSKTSAACTSHIEIYEEKGQKKTRIVGLSAFKDNKLIGQFNKAETRGYLLLTNNVEGGIIVVDCPQGDGKASLEITRARTKLTPKVEGSQVSFKVEVFIETNLGGQTCLKNLTTPELMKTLARRQATVIRNEIRAALERAQEFNTDVFMLGETVHKKYPNKWKNLETRWDQVFPEISLEIDVKTVVRLEGLTMKPPIPQ